jgi:cytochrome c biogenesis protein ResB
VNRSFESHVIFVDPVRELERGVRIYMNHPLRHRLLTFYQSSFDRNDTVTVLSVVRNTGLVVPYVATVVIGLGLLIQFITLLVMRRRRGL